MFSILIHLLLFNNVVEENGKKDRQPPVFKDIKAENEKMTKNIQNNGSQEQQPVQGKVKSPERIIATDATKTGSPSPESAAKKSIVTVADVHTPSEPQEDLVASTQSEIATVVSSESVEPKVQEKKESKEAEGNQLPSDSQQTLPSDQKVSEEKKSNEPSAAKITEPSSVQEAKPIQSSVAIVSSPEKETMEVKDAKEGSQKMAEDAKQLKKADSGPVVEQSMVATSKEDQPVDTETVVSAKVPSKDENKESKSVEKAIDSKDGQSGDAKPSVKINDDGVNQGEKETTDAADDDKVDASKSFQVLPSKNQPSDNLNQELDDTGNLGLPKPPTESIRKTSFTVLKSDESIDDLLAGMDQNQNEEMTNDTSEKKLTRPKSFKVLKSHDPSGEDIILHQSSDQEVGGDVHFEDYLNRNLAYGGGKYSDSELVKSDGQFNGRRKKYKKRAKSVKQLTIVDGLNKDHDSGFEPSPRTLRSSQKNLTTRAIYAAGLNMPERPRVGDTIIDGRSVSSRFDSHRKIGDKNACNMTTVSQTLQRNIRR